MLSGKESFQKEEFMLEGMASHFSFPLTYLPFSIIKNNYYRFFLDSSLPNMVFSRTCFLSNGISFLRKRKVSMAKNSELLKRYLIDTLEGVAVYALLLVTAKLTCLLSELLRIPGWAPVMKLLELVIIVCASVACGLFVINNTHEYMKLFFGKDWWKRLLLFLRRYLW